jgi:hypothetical protein
VAGALAACASTYVTSSGDGGVDAHHHLEAGADVDASHARDGRADVSRPDGGGDSGSCVPVTVIPFPDAGGPACMADAGGPDGGSMCPPISETGLAFTWVPPIGLYTGDCTQTEIGDFITSCVNTATGTMTACTSFRTSKPACYGCLITTSMESKWGALVSYGTGENAVVNIAGCVAALEPCNQPCAEAIEASGVCQAGACEHCSGSDFGACTDQATKCPACEGYQTSLTCLLALTGKDHPASVCYSSTSTFTEKITNVATVLCGHKP